MERQPSGAEGLTEPKRLWKFRYLIAIGAFAMAGFWLYHRPDEIGMAITAGVTNGAFLGACLTGGSYLDRRTLWTRWRGALTVAALMGTAFACTAAFGPKRSYDDPVPYEEPLYRGG